jgi:cell division protein FtsQ
MEEQRRFVRSNANMDALRSEQDRKRRRRSVIYLSLFLSVTLIFLAVCFFVFFKVSEIRVENNEIYSESQIIESLTFSMGDNLFSFRAEDAEAALRKNLPYIGEVEITRTLPNVVTVTISERKAEMSLVLGEDAYLISGDLQVLGRIGGGEITAGVTRVFTSSVERCLVGESVSFVDTRTADNLKELYRCLAENDMMQYVREINMVSRFDITINYADRFTVYLADIDNMDIKIRFLVKILEKLKPTDTGYINLADHREAAVRLDETEPQPAE